MRLFDIAINGKTVIKNLDIWKEAGCYRALKKMVKTTISGSKLIISFPRSASGQAIISAIAIASLKQNIQVASLPSLVTNVSSKNCKLLSWLDARINSIVMPPFGFVLCPQIYMVLIGFSFQKLPFKQSFI